MADVLKSVDDYNQEKRAEKAEYDRKQRLTGVACPKCGRELEWAEAFLSTLQYPLPSTRKAWCKKCNLTVQLER